MPELPEVQTTVDEVRPHVEGHKIIRVRVLRELSIGSPSIPDFVEGLTGRSVVSISRRGKYLVFDLDNHTFLIIHMRMTGSLLIKAATEKPEAYIRVVIYLDNKKAVHFRDPRVFGRMWLVDDKEAIVGNLGIDALDPGFGPAALGEILAPRKIPVKSVLLDQSKIAGIGNMYADEALYAARIHPQRPANSLTKDEIKRLNDAIQRVLRRGLRQKGASTQTYFRPGGTKGEAHLNFVVAHRKGEECPVCGGAIERIVVGQRGTFYCPKCQKIKAKGITQKSKRQA